MIGFDDHVDFHTAHVGQHYWLFSSIFTIPSLHPYVSSRIPLVAIFYGGPHGCWGCLVTCGWVEPCCIASNCVVILFSMTLTLDFGWSRSQQLGFWGLCCKNMTMKGGHPYFGWPKYQCFSPLWPLTSAHSPTKPILFPSLLKLYVLYSNHHKVLVWYYTWSCSLLGNKLFQMLYTTLAVLSI